MVIIRKSSFIYAVVVLNASLSQCYSLPQDWDFPEDSEMIFLYRWFLKIFQRTKIVEKIMPRCLRILYILSILRKLMNSKIILFWSCYIIY